MRALRIFQILLFLGFLGSTLTVVAQRTRELTREESIRVELEERRRVDQQFERLRNLDPNNPRRAVLRKPVSMVKIKPTRKDLEAVAVNAEDTAKFAAFLKQPRTGIFRLHDIAKCEASEKIYDVDEPCPAHLVEKGSAYSFQEKDYAPKWLANISLEAATFRIWKFEALNFLTDLGNAPLENLNLTSDGVREMNEFSPSNDKQEVSTQRRVAAKGFQVGKFIYKTKCPLRENSTYALRSIAYPFEGGAGKRLDIIVVFRVVRSHGDGSVSILWKELQRKDAPKFANKKSLAQNHPSPYQ